MAETTLAKNKDGYGYKYTELAEIHRYLEENNMAYYQEIETHPTNGCDYIQTYRYIDGKWEEKPKRGCKIVDATLQGIKNPAQEQGSALTYARRYSLLMAFGLATEDDDAASLGKQKGSNKKETQKTDKITDVEAKSIYSLMVRKGLEVIPLLQKNYGISNTADLTKEQYISILKTVKDMPDKKTEQS